MPNPEVYLLAKDEEDRRREEARLSLEEKSRAQVKERLRQSIAEIGEQLQSVETESGKLIKLINERQQEIESLQWQIDQGGVSVDQMIGFITRRDALRALLLADRKNHSIAQTNHARLANEQARLYTLMSQINFLSDTAPVEEILRRQGAL